MKIRIIPPKEKKEEREDDDKKRIVTEKRVRTRGIRFATACDINIPLMMEPEVETFFLSSFLLPFSKGFAFKIKANLQKKVF